MRTFRLVTARCLEAGCLEASVTTPSGNFGASETVSQLEIVRQRPGLLMMIGSDGVASLALAMTQLAGRHAFRFYYQTTLSPLSSTGRPSIPETLVLERRDRGVLDAP